MARPSAIPSARWRGIRRLIAAGLGIAAGLLLLDLVWPSADRRQDNRERREASDLAKPPSRAVTVLVIGVDSERLGDAANHAAPPGPANADALLLVRVNPHGPLQVLSVPPQLAVQLPGQRRPQALGSLYRLGGAALTADALRELLGLAPGEPDRFVVLSRGSLRTLVDELGSVEASPPQLMRYRDRKQGLAINLQAGLQRLRGEGVEQLARYRDPLRPVEGRQDQHLEIAQSLRREMAMPHQIVRLPELSRRLIGAVHTNLSTAELLSLLAVGLNPGQQTEWQPLALAPARGPGQDRLRESAEPPSRALWPAPQVAADATNQP